MIPARYILSGKVLHCHFIAAVLLFGLGAAPATNQSLNDTPIPQKSGTDGTAKPAPKKTGDAFDITRVVLAMGIVLGTIFGLRWLGRRFFALPTGQNAAGAVRVLGRTTLGPRQQLLLIHVGRRVVLAANTGTQINPLCEIHDPEEVAQLLRDTSGRKTELPPAAFDEALGEADGTYEAAQRERSVEEVVAKAEEASVADTRREITGLMDKVRTLAKQFGK